MISHCRYSAPSAVLPASVLTLCEVPYRLFIQLAVPTITCIVPIPWSQAMMVDCQPLSCQATAFIRFTGTVISEPSPVYPTGLRTPTHHGLPAAATSAVLTSANGAFGPE